MELSGGHCCELDADLSLTPEKDSSVGEVDVEVALEGDLNVSDLTELEEHELIETTPDFEVRETRFSTLGCR